MDNLTHSLFGLTLARTSLGRAGRGATAALVLASNAPDIDILAAAGGAASYLRWHRGPTHGPLGVVGLGLCVAIVLSAGARWRRKTSIEPPASFAGLFAISVVGVLCHVLMDLPTSYGTRALSPFVWMWFAQDWVPIVDIYLLAILGSGLWLWRSSRSRSAAIALVLVLANCAFRAASHHQALARADNIFGTEMTNRCSQSVARGGLIDWWPRPVSIGPRELAATRCLMEVAAVPDFLSPFRWRLIAQFSNAYEIREVDVLGERLQPSPIRPLTSTRYPNQWTPAVVRAAEAPIARTFLAFSRFPAARSTLDADGSATVRWTDVRFAGPRSADRRPGGSTLFNATVRVAADGVILEQRLGR